MKIASMRERIPGSAGILPASPRALPKWARMPALADSEGEIIRWMVLVPEAGG